MYYYKVFGYIFRCKYEIKQLHAVSATDQYDVDIIIGEMPEEIVEETAQIEERPYMFWNNEHFWLSNRYGTLAVYKSGIIYAHNPASDEVLYLLQFVLGYGIAMYAHMHNRIALHCGCVAIDGNALIISGSSGSGKSTLTHELIADGAVMLSDDVIAIGYDEDNIPCIYPAFPQQKLCRDAALNKGYDLNELIYIDPDKDKFAIIHNENFSPEPHKPHTYLYLKCYNADEELSSAEKLQISKIDGFNKVSLIMKCLYLGSLIPNMGLSAEAFQLCVDLMKDCNVYQVKRTQKENTLPEIMQFIKANLPQ